MRSSTSSDNGSYAPPPPMGTGIHDARPDVDGANGPPSPFIPWSTDSWRSAVRRMFWRRSVRASASAIASTAGFGTERGRRIDVPAGGAAPRAAAVAAVAAVEGGVLLTWS